MTSYHDKRQGATGSNRQNPDQGIEIACSLQIPSPYAASLAGDIGSLQPRALFREYAIGGPLRRTLPYEPELAAAEPNTLKAIKSLRPKGPRRIWNQFDTEEYKERVEGALLGRMAGCTLVPYGTQEQKKARPVIVKERGLQWHKLECIAWSAWPFRDGHPIRSG